MNSTTITTKDLFQQPAFMGKGSYAPLENSSQKTPLSFASLPVLTAGSEGQQLLTTYSYPAVALCQASVNKQ